MNFQITVLDSGALAAELRRAGVELFLEPETKWYVVGDGEAGVHQFLVQDPDGYLIRFQSSVGHRPPPGPPGPPVPLPGSPSGRSSRGQ